MTRFDLDAQSRLQTVCMLVLVAVALTHLVYWLRPVLVPLVLAVFVVSGISPVLDMLERRLGVTRIVAAGLTFCSGVLVLLVFGISIWHSMWEMSNNAGAYRSRVRDLVEQVETHIPRNLSFLRNPEDPETPAEPVVVNPKATDERIAHFIDSMLRDGISVVTQSLVTLVSTSVVVLIFVFFLLLGAPVIEGGNQSIQEINQQVRSYLSLKTVISIFTGIAFGIALRLFGVPMAFTFGVMAFLLNFVPNVGPIVASLLPIPLIVIDPNGSLLWMIGVISVTSSIQLISGNLVEPKLMGESSDLHPVTILLALMFWGMMWGVIGMFLATPITAALKIMLERIEPTRPIADLMAGRYGRSTIVDRVTA